MRRTTNVLPCRASMSFTPLRDSLDNEGPLSVVLDSGIVIRPAMKRASLFMAGLTNASSLRGI